MKTALRCIGVLIGVLLALYCLGDIAQTTEVLHSHHFEWDGVILKRNYMLLVRWGAWLFIAAALIAISVFALRRKRS